MTDWMISIQKMMRTTLSVRVSDFTITIEMPKASAASSTTRCPVSIVSSPGRTMMTMPTRPSAIAVTRGRVNFSPRKVTASSAVQIGVVNSMEISSASGISVSA